MSRLGFMYQDEQRDSTSLDEIQQASFLPGISIEGIFTHFSNADEPGDAYQFTLKQFNLFNSAVRNLKMR